MNPGTSWLQAEPLPTASVIFRSAHFQRYRPPSRTSAPETSRLQAHDPSGVLGFNWGIDPASPEQVRQAQIGMRPRPPRLDHDALADSVVEHKTIYRSYSKNTWKLIDLPD